MLAGLPKAPSANNPIVNPERATRRQRYIIDRMLENGFITVAERDAALKQVLKYRAPSEVAVHAEYVAEKARQLIFSQYGDEAYTRGLNVYLTLNSAEQTLAYHALRKGIMDYEKRQVYRGPEDYIDLPADRSELDARIAEALQDFPDNDELRAAVVTEASPKKVVAMLQNGESVTVTGDGLKPATSGLAPKANPKTQIRPGAVVRLIRGPKGDWSITQLPEVEGALRRDGSAHRQRPRDGRRLRLLEEQVQPRHAGLAPAGLELQALHLLGGAREGLHAGDGDQRRAALLRRRHDRQPALGAEELRRHLRRPDDDAARPGQVEEHDLDPHPQVDRPGLRAAVDHALRLRRRQAPGLPDDGARRRRGHAAADGVGLQRLRQRRLPRQPAADQPHHRQQGPRPQRGARADARRVGANDRRAQRLRHDQPAAGGHAHRAPRRRRRRR